jgi:hypothetical protein
VGAGAVPEAGFSPESPESGASCSCDDPVLPDCEPEPEPEPDHDEPDEDESDDEDGWESPLPARSRHESRVSPL